MTHTLHTGDVLDILATMPDEYFAGVFCDPPYGYTFMGKRWDHGVPSSAVWAEVWRVLKPGAILMAFGGTRTWHRLAVNIEDAGFEMFDTVMWLHGQGFPKSTDISKMIDKEAGQVRDELYLSPNRRPGHENGKSWKQASPDSMNYHITAPATDAARTWEGYGTALKPSWEPCLLFRKPRRSTYAQTAQEHGTGCINVDGCRIGYTDDADKKAGWPVSRSYTASGYDFDNGEKSHIQITQPITPQPAGRWPANVILSPESAAELDRISGDVVARNGGNTGGTPGYDGGWNNHQTQTYRDTGGASRFFYCAKSSRSEREAGLEGLPLRDSYTHNIDGRDKSNPSNALGGGERKRVERGEVGIQQARNNHPCVKPLALCEYLARLIVPPVAYHDDARLLVPYCGSGSEMIGALRAGWLHVDGIDDDADYVEIARRRIAADMPLFAEAA